jgi:hypothetical protein
MQGSHLAKGLSLKVTSLEPNPDPDVPCAPPTTHDMALSWPSPSVCPAAALKGEPPKPTPAAALLLSSCPAENDPSFWLLRFRAGETPKGSDAAGMGLLLSGLWSSVSVRSASAGTCARRPLFCTAWVLYQRCLADEPYLQI